ncbi:xanthine dehydrogenase small subunit [Cellvibrio sp. NN19]|uniref:xanthine dehydrogenase small subunit n=1 Tax=Cellvibrio chitinivorans TaxID=3102792 RepID=UPI002B413929|nr:xanthine dehydrogenase small subunit [Cellvibrio sp. NN19]
MPEQGRNEPDWQISAITNCYKQVMAINRSAGGKSVQFVVNNKQVEVDDAAADMTLLQYLRSQQHLVGTKEGCASGDCGACTVMVARNDEGHSAAYIAVNACICPLGSLHGCSVFTVDGLAAEGADLHPVQAAMVECHGSQCGFCTPGFVMSLTALHATSGDELAGADSAIQRAAVLDAISGNLCRCTGYRPIVEAGIAALKKPNQVASFVQEWDPDAPLASTDDESSEASCKILSAGESRFWQPKTESELQALFATNPQARLVAGGTDLILEVTQLYKSLPQLIDLSRIASLNQIEISDDVVVIGAAATYRQIEQTLKSLSPEFIALLGRLGSRQIRNRGTLGGNIANASPIADSPPYLLVLDAELEIVNSSGATRIEALANFYHDYKKTTLAQGEYIARIRIARANLNKPLKLFKVSKRYEDDISAVMGAFCWSDDGFKIAFGGMAGIPKRATATEQFLSAQSWCDSGVVDEALLEQACDLLRSEFAPMTDVRASAAYRMAMACNLLKKACYEFAAEASGTVIEERLFDHA